MAEIDFFGQDVQVIHMKSEVVPAALWYRWTTAVKNIPQIELNILWTDYAVTYFNYAGKLIINT